MLQYLFGNNQIERLSLERFGADIVLGVGSACVRLEPKGFPTVARRADLDHVHGPIIQRADKLFTVSIGDYPSPLGITHAEQPIEARSRVVAPTPRQSPRQSLDEPPQKPAAGLPRP